MERSKIDNALGTICKVAIVLWTIFCAYGIFSGLAEVGRSTNGELSTAGAIGVAAGLTFWGVWWIIPTLGAATIYFVFGRSEPPPYPQRGGMSASREFDMESREKKCPSCAEAIKLEALVCRFCGHKFEPDEVYNTIWQTYNTLADKDELEKRRHTLTPEEKDILSRGFCPNCAAYKVFTRDLSKNLRICKACGMEYSLVA